MSKTDIIAQLDGDVSIDIQFLDKVLTDQLILSILENVEYGMVVFDLPSHITLDPNIKKNSSSSIEDSWNFYSRIRDFEEVLRLLQSLFRCYSRERDSDSSIPSPIYTIIKPFVEILLRHGIVDKCIGALMALHKLDSSLPYIPVYGSESFSHEMKTTVQKVTRKLMLLETLLLIFFVEPCSLTQFESLVNLFGPSHGIHIPSTQRSFLYMSLNSDVIALRLWRMYTHLASSVLLESLHLSNGTVPTPKEFMNGDLITKSFSGFLISSDEGETNRFLSCCRTLFTLAEKIRVGKEAAELERESLGSDGSPFEIIPFLLPDLEYNPLIPVLFGLSVFLQLHMLRLRSAEIAISYGKSEGRDLESFPMVTILASKLSMKLRKLISDPESPISMVGLLVNGPDHPLSLSAASLSIKAALRDTELNIPRRSLVPNLHALSLEESVDSNSLSSTSGVLQEVSELFQDPLVTSSWRSHLISLIENEDSSLTSLASEDALLSGDQFPLQTLLQKKASLFRSVRSCSLFQEADGDKSHAALFTREATADSVSQLLAVSALNLISAAIATRILSGYSGVLSPLEAHTARETLLLSEAVAAALRVAPVVSEALWTQVAEWASRSAPGSPQTEDPAALIPPALLCVFRAAALMFPHRTSLLELLAASAVSPAAAATALEVVQSDCRTLLLSSTELAPEDPGAETVDVPAHVRTQTLLEHTVPPESRIIAQYRFSSGAHVSLNDLDTLEELRTPSDSGSSLSGTLAQRRALESQIRHKLTMGEAQWTRAAMVDASALASMLRGAGVGSQTSVDVSLPLPHSASDSQLPAYLLGNCAAPELRRSLHPRELRSWQALAPLLGPSSGTCYVRLFDGVDLYLLGFEHSQGLPLLAACRNQALLGLRALADTEAASSIASALRSEVDVTPGSQRQANQCLQALSSAFSVVAPVLRFLNAVLAAGIDIFAPQVLEEGQVADSSDSLVSALVDALGALWPLYEAATEVLQRPCLPASSGASASVCEELRQPVVLLSVFLARLAAAAPRSVASACFSSLHSNNLNEASSAPSNSTGRFGLSSRRTIGMAKTMGNTTNSLASSVRTARGHEVLEAGPISPPRFNLPQILARALGLEAPLGRFPLAISLARALRCCLPAQLDRVRAAGAHPFLLALLAAFQRARELAQPTGGPGVDAAALLRALARAPPRCSATTLVASLEYFAIERASSPSELLEEDLFALLKHCERPSPVVRAALIERLASTIPLEAASAQVEELEAHLQVVGIPDARQLRAARAHGGIAAVVDACVAALHVARASRPSQHAAAQLLLQSEALRTLLLIVEVDGRLSLLFGPVSSCPTVSSLNNGPDGDDILFSLSFETTLSLRAHSRFTQALAEAASQLLGHRSSSQDGLLCSEKAAAPLSATAAADTNLLESVTSLALRLMKGLLQSSLDVAALAQRDMRAPTPCAPLQRAARESIEQSLRLLTEPAGLPLFTNGAVAAPLPPLQLLVLLLSYRRDCLVVPVSDALVAVPGLRHAAQALLLQASRLLTTTSSESRSLMALLRPHQDALRALMYLPAETGQQLLSFVYARDPATAKRMLELFASSKVPKGLVLADPLYFRQSLLLLRESLCACSEHDAALPLPALSVFQPSSLPGTSSTSIGRPDSRLAGLLKPSSGASAGGVHLAPKAALETALLPFLTDAMNTLNEYGRLDDRSSALPFDLRTRLFAIRTELLGFLHELLLPPFGNGNGETPLTHSLSLAHPVTHSLALTHPPAPPSRRLSVAERRLLSASLSGHSEFWMFLQQSLQAVAPRALLSSAGFRTDAQVLSLFAPDFVAVVSGRADDMQDQVSVRRDGQGEKEVEKEEEEGEGPLAQAAFTSRALACARFAVDLLSRPDASAALPAATSAQQSLLRWLRELQALLTDSTGELAFCEADALAALRELRRRATATFVPLEPFLNASLLSPLPVSLVEAQSSINLHIIPSFRSAMAASEGPSALINVVSLAASLGVSSLWTLLQSAPLVAEHPSLTNIEPTRGTDAEEAAGARLKALSSSLYTDNGSVDVSNLPERDAGVADEFRKLQGSLALCLAAARAGTAVAGLRARNAFLLALLHLPATLEVSVGSSAAEARLNGVVCVLRALRRGLSSLPSLVDSGALAQMLLAADELLVPSANIVRETVTAALKAASQSDLLPVPVQQALVALLSELRALSSTLAEARSALQDSESLLQMHLGAVLVDLAAFAVRALSHAASEASAPLDLASLDADALAVALDALTLSSRALARSQDLTKSISPLGDSITALATSSRLENLQREDTTLAVTAYGALCRGPDAKVSADLLFRSLELLQVLLDSGASLESPPALEGLGRATEQVRVLFEVVSRVSSVGLAQALALTDASSPPSINLSMNGTGVPLPGPCALCSSSQEELAATQVLLPLLPLCTQFFRSLAAHSLPLANTLIVAHVPSAVASAPVWQTLDRALAAVERLGASAPNLGTSAALGAAGTPRRNCLCRYDFGLGLDTTLISSEPDSPSRIALVQLATRCGLNEHSEIRFPLVQALADVLATFASLTARFKAHTHFAVTADDSPIALESVYEAPSLAVEWVGVVPAAVEFVEAHPRLALAPVSVLLRLPPLARSSGLLRLHSSQHGHSRLLADAIEALFALGTEVLDPCELSLPFVTPLSSGPASGAASTNLCADYNVMSVFRGSPATLPPLYVFKQLAGPRLLQSVLLSLPDLALPVLQVITASLVKRSALKQAAAAAGTGNSTNTSASGARNADIAASPVLRRQAGSHSGASVMLQQLLSLQQRHRQDIFSSLSQRTSSAAPVQQLLEVSEVVLRALAVQTIHFLSVAIKASDAMGLSNLEADISYSVVAAKDQDICSHLDSRTDSITNSNATNSSNNNATFESTSQIGGGLLTPLQESPLAHTQFTAHSRTPFTSTPARADVGPARSQEDAIDQPRFGAMEVEGTARDSKWSDTPWASSSSSHALAGTSSFGMSMSFGGKGHASGTLADFGATGTVGGASSDLQRLQGARNTALQHMRALSAHAASSTGGIEQEANLSNLSYEVVRQRGRQLLFPIVTVAGPSEPLASEPGAEDRSRSAETSLMNILLLLSAFEALMNVISKSEPMKNDSMKSVFATAAAAFRTRAGGRSEVDAIVGTDLTETTLQQFVRTYGLLGRYDAFSPELQDSKKLFHTFPVSEEDVTGLESTCFALLNLILRSSRTLLRTLLPPSGASPARAFLEGSLQRRVANVLLPLIVAVFGDGGFSEQFLALLLLADVDSRRYGLRLASAPAAGASLNDSSVSLGLEPSRSEAIDKGLSVPPRSATHFDALLSRGAANKSEVAGACLSARLGALRVLNALFCSADLQQRLESSYVPGRSDTSTAGAFFPPSAGLHLPLVCAAADAGGLTSLAMLPTLFCALRDKYSDSLKAELKSQAASQEDVLAHSLLELQSTLMHLRTLVRDLAALAIPESAYGDFLQLIYSGQWSRVLFSAEDADAARMVASEAKQYLVAAVDRRLDVTAISEEARIQSTGRYLPSPEKLNAFASHLNIL